MIFLALNILKSNNGILLLFSIDEFFNLIYSLSIFFDDYFVFLYSYPNIILEH